MERGETNGVDQVLRHASRRPSAPGQMSTTPDGRRSAPDRAGAHGPVSPAEDGVDRVHGQGERDQLEDGQTRATAELAAHGSSPCGQGLDRGRSGASTPDDGPRRSGQHVSLLPPSLGVGMRSE